MIGGWVTGVDVARHQRPDRCDWAKARDAGLDFAFVKLTEGKDYVDPAAYEHIKRLRRALLPFGVYHFARPDNRFRETSDGWEAGRIEAEHALRCHEAVGLCSEPIALDQEKVTPRELKISDQQRGDFVRSFVATIEARLDEPPIIYTGDDYWRSQMPDELAVELRSQGCLLWLADHTKAEEPRAKEVIAGWPWTIWQHSGGGKTAYADPIPGLPSPIDTNRYRGSIAELRGLMGVR